MPRHARLDTPGTLHHVMARGIEGSPVFIDEGDRNRFLGCVEDLVNLTATRIVAWSLMRNHFHFLLFSGPQGLSSFMGKLMTRYAVYFNRRHHRVGHLFQNRYKSIVCEEESYLLELVRYIHLNPLRVKAVKNLEELDGYAWCGHGVLMGNTVNTWQDRRYVLDYFSPLPERAVLLYRDFVDEAKERGKRPELTGGGLIRSVGGVPEASHGKDARSAYDARVLGSGIFVERIRTVAGKEKDRPLLNRDDHINTIIGTYCKESGIPEEQLKAGSRRRMASKARAAIAQILVHEVGVSLTETARLLGVSPSAIANILVKAERNQAK